MLRRGIRRGCIRPWGRRARARRTADMVSIITLPAPNRTHHVRDRDFHHRKRRRPKEPEQQPIQDPLRISLCTRHPKHHPGNCKRRPDIDRTFPQCQRQGLQEQGAEAYGKVCEAGALVELFEGEASGLAQGDKDGEEGRGGERGGEGVSDVAVVSADRASE